MEEIKSYKSENISKSSSSLKRIGNFIKEARISRNQSIQELASALKIGEHQLQAIEEGNQDLLLEKWSLELCSKVVKELKNLELSLIHI